ncbi:beta-ketoacyl-[acyl-carrier-protein] synthase family protein [Amycolatopsis alba]|uniref:3-oxoacyl-ACP synthase n=1 Tax=Amycolatopsis alba DSM 44262 TaxID=1125972 RepID=A0A229RTB6_AMYAL|nr:beta-ketoacyl-[acyl-carrier-protein] synthase family protein [Amycolatopsis alba]OXM49751.1 3-oxoacyl-ACP synthase [Amycolatopsis alba DSM 44262]
MNSPRVVVTGMGLVSAAGTSLSENWRRVIAGEPTAARDPALAGCPIDFTCRAPDFEPSRYLGRRGAATADRFTQLALVAADEAVSEAKLRLDETDLTRFGVVIGTMSGGMTTIERQHARLLEGGSSTVSGRTMLMGMTSVAASALSIHHGLRGTCLTVSTACASGTVAIGTACQLIRSGTVDVVLAGGADSPLTPLQVAALDRLSALSRRNDDPGRASRPFDADRDGAVLGEGAGILLLESESHAMARGAPQLAEIAGYGDSSDGYHIVQPDPDGAGAQSAMRAALADAGLSPRDVDYINAHGTSTRSSDEIECTAISAIFGDSPAVSSTKGVTGHTCGAAGGLEAAYSILALRDSCVPPTANLTDPDPSIKVDLVADQARHAPLRAVMSNSFGIGGHNASLVITSL